jgi:hypothetical protein
VLNVTVLQAVLGRKLFLEAWFQLCDLWTDAICETEYAEFLDLVTACLTTKDKHGRCKLVEVGKAQRRWSRC